MRIYLASRYSRFEEMQQYATQLEGFGHSITSRWIKGNHQIDDKGLSVQADSKLRTQFAVEDFEDIVAANCIISFTEAPRSSNSRGGRHVELGIGIGRSMKLLVVGHRENIFHCLPNVDFHESWETALEDIKKWAA